MLRVIKMKEEIQSNLNVTGKKTAGAASLQVSCHLGTQIKVLSATAGESERASALNDTNTFPIH